MRAGGFYPDHGLQRIVDFHERQDVRYATAAAELSAATGKPILTATELAIADPQNPGPATVRATGRLCYPSGHRAVTALGHLWRDSRHRRRRGLAPRGSLMARRDDTRSVAGPRRRRPRPGAGAVRSLALRRRTEPTRPSSRSRRRPWPAPDAAPPRCGAEHAAAVVPPRPGTDRPRPQRRRLRRRCRLLRRHARRRPRASSSNSTASRSAPTTPTCR